MYSCDEHEKSLYKSYKFHNLRAGSAFAFTQFDQEAISS